MMRDRALLQVLGITWLSFLAAGLVIHFCFAPSRLVVLIDRSYCPPSQWQAVTRIYTGLYRQYQLKQVVLESVILVSDLGEESYATPPRPSVLQTASTYGRSNLQRLDELQQTYPKMQLLRCSI